MRWIGVLAAVAALQGAAAANATVVEFSGSDATGWVNGSFNYDQTQAQGYAIHLGTMFISYSEDPGEDNISFTSSISGSPVSAGNTYRISAIRDISGEGSKYLAVTVSGDTGPDDSFELQLGFPDRKPIDDNSLPIIVPAGEGIFYENSSAGELSLPVEYKTVSPVPEADTWEMMILGFGAFGGMVRRRRRLADLNVRTAYAQLVP